MFTKPSYYFTEVDPDYRIKGSRDPLGLQVLWQDQAHKIIPFLSTVSNNLNDFHILCLAYHLYGKEPDNQFVNYFMQFEKLMAFVRCRYGIDSNFNGVRKVKRILFDDDTKRIRISNNPSNAILSNQRAYGIWGKYSRPFGDLKLLNHPHFSEVMEAKVSKLNGDASFHKILKQLEKKDEFLIDIEELEFFKSLFDYNQKDREFYENTLLKVNSKKNYQEELLAFLKSRKVNSTLDFYSFLQAFKNSPEAKDEDLQFTLLETEATEKILAPLNHIFRYLQRKTIWTKEEIEADSNISAYKNVPLYSFYDNAEENKIKNEMSSALQMNNWLLTLYLVRRNKDITRRRNGAAWMTQKGDLLEVHLSETNLFNENFDPLIDNYNNYFIDSYLSIYRKIYEN